jgi:hypothetical protein
LTAGSTYGLAVKAKDVVGNQSAQSVILKVTTSQNSGDGLKGEYYNSIALSGTPSLTRIDPQINFNWGTTAPASTLNASNFSVRWTGEVQAPVAGSYVFSTTSDDGVRLWINDVLVINNWTNHSSTTNNSSAISLNAGIHYKMKMEYYDASGGAIAKLLWSYPGVSNVVIPQRYLFSRQGATQETEAPSSENGLAASYYNTRDLSGAIVLSRIDPKIDFNWQFGSPATTINTNYFSARWKGLIKAPVSGSYTFVTQSDDGVSVWLDGSLLINNWTPHNLTTNASSPVNLISGKVYPIVVEYFEGGGGACVNLQWKYPGQSQQIIPHTAFFVEQAALAQAMDSVDFIEEDNNVGVEIFPNPTDGKLITLKISDGNPGEARIIISNITSKIVLLKDVYFSKGQNEIQLSLDDLSEGLYLIQLKRRDKNLYQRLVVR